MNINPRTITDRVNHTARATLDKLPTPNDSDTNPFDRIVLAGLSVGTAARLTRLVAADTITEPVREKVMFDRDQRKAVAAGEMVPPPANRKAAAARAKAHELVTCQWCTGMWISAATVAAAATIGHTRAFRYTAGALTCAYAVGFLAAHED